MKKRITNILLILVLFGYLIFIGRSDYMFGWLASNNFCYVWAVIAALWFFKQDICAKWLTFGSIFGVFPAQIAENIKTLQLENNPAKDSTYWGVGVWIAIVVLTLALGVFFQYRNWRKTHPKKVKEPEETKEE